MHTVFLGIGGNLGNRQKNLQKCREMVVNKIGSITLFSSVYRTAAWGMENAPDFYNQVLKVETELSPQETLDACHEIESSFGRERSKSGYLSRQMDVDILFYDDLMKREKQLEIPHPRMTERNFVLVPLAEIAAEKIHPAYRKTVAELLNESLDKGLVEKLNEV